MSTASDLYARPKARLHHLRDTAHDGSWHSNLVQTISSYVSNLPSNGCILHLACSTDLSTFALAVQCHDATIIGRYKLNSISTAYLDLDSLAADQGGAFDVIVCVLVITLLPDPYKALAHWHKYLAPGGIVVLRVTRPQNLIAGVVYRCTAAKLGISVPYHQNWSQSKESLLDVFDKTDLEVLSIEFDNRKDEVRTSYGTDNGIADAVFEAQSKIPIGDASHPEAARSLDFLKHARELFRDEWATQRSKVPSEEVCGDLLGVARKLFSAALKAPVNSPRVAGGCRCSAVRYEAYSRPKDIVACHCFMCGRLSGSGNLPLVAVPTDSFRYVESRGLKTLRLSEVASLTFPTECGSPVSIVFDGTQGYENETGKTNIILGNVDMKCMGDEAPEVWGHMFIGEKCSWETLPDDGAQRLREFTSDAE